MLGDRWQDGNGVPEGYVLSDYDGLPAREQGPWAKEKLGFLKKYLPGALTATKKMGGETHYVDLYAGPGRNAWIDGHRHHDFPGSPLIALGAHAIFIDRERPKGFGHLHLCNLDELDHELLERRVEKRTAELSDRMDVAEVHPWHGDANKLVHRIRDEIPNWAYVLAFLDIEGPSDLAFSTIEALRAEHEKVDLYVRYPMSDLRRLLPYDNVHELEQNRPTLDRYFGTEAWEPIYERRTTDAQGKTMDLELLRLYEEQLGKLWNHVKNVRRVPGPKAFAYHMVFAANHPAAWRISDSATGEESGQGVLLP